MGGSLLMDDANVPSLLSAPYLGYAYDAAIYRSTKKYESGVHTCPILQE